MVATKTVAKRKQSTSIRGLDKAAQMIKASPIRPKTADDYKDLFELLDELGVPDKQCVRVQISSEQAKVFVRHNSPNNRYGPNTKYPNGGVTRIKLYKSDMQLMEWDEWNTDPLTVDENGYLLSGYKRCAALSQIPGLSLSFFVARGVPPKTLESMDRQQSRTLMQSIRVRNDFEVSSLEAQIVSSMLWKIDTSSNIEKLTDKQKLALFNKYRKAILFAAKIYSTKRDSITTAAVRGAIARVYASLAGVNEKTGELYDLDSDTAEELSAFVCALDTSKAIEPREEVAIKLRNDAMALRPRGSTRAVKEILYAKSINALHLYFTNNVPQRLVVARKQYFPLQEDQA